MTDAMDFKDGLLTAIPNLRAFAISLCGTADKADDLVQETLVRAWDKQASFQPGTNLRAWLFTILRNEFYSQMRKRGREVEVLLGLCVHPQKGPRLRAHRLPRASARAAAVAAQPAGTMAPFARNDKTVLEIALPALVGFNAGVSLHAARS